METKSVTIEIPAGKKAEWKEVSGQKVIVLVDEKDNHPVTERIKTFEDALNELGEGHQLVKEYRVIDGKIGNNLLAYQKLCIIVAALNEGWRPDWTNIDEFKWGPWFDILTPKEVEQYVDKCKWLWLFGGSSSNGAACGLAAAASYHGRSYADSARSARLALKSEELSIYCAKQFIYLWGEYLINW